MKHLVSFALLIWSACLCHASEPVKPVPIIVFVNENSAVVRAANSSQATKFGSFGRDTALHLHSYGDRRHYVSGMTNGQYICGWIWAEYLSGDFDEAASVESKSGPIDLRGRAFSTSDVRDAKEAIIRKDIAQRDKECSCPYQTNKQGHQCGYRSAWTKWSGERPLCYATDVSLADLDNYFARNADGT